MWRPGGKHRCHGLSEVLSANALLSTVAKQQWVGAVPTVTL